MSIRTPAEPGAPGVPAPSGNRLAHVLAVGMDAASKSAAADFSQTRFRFLDEWRDVSEKFDGVFQDTPGKDYLRIMDAKMRETRDATASTERGAILADFEAAFNAGEREFAQWLSQEAMIMRAVWNMAFDDEGMPPAPMQRMMALLGRYSR